MLKKIKLSYDSMNSDKGREMVPVFELRFLLVLSKSSLA